MKKHILLFTITISISTLVSGQQQNSFSSDSTLIIQFENEWAKALINRDEKIFTKYLADDFFYTENEKMYSRDEVIQSVMSVTETIKSAYNEDMQVHIKDKTAIVTGWLFVNGNSNTGSFKRKYRFTDIWYNQKGSWKLIGAQDYLLP